MLNLVEKIIEHFIEINEDVNLDEILDGKYLYMFDSTYVYILNNDLDSFLYEYNNDTCEYYKNEIQSLLDRHGYGNFYIPDSVYFDNFELTLQDVIGAVPKYQDNKGSLYLLHSVKDIIPDRFYQDIFYDN